MIGVFVGLLCALTWAVGSIMMRDLSRKLDPITLNAPRTLVGGVVMLGLVFATGRQTGYAAITPLQLFFMLGSMAVGGGIGDALYVTSLSRIGVARAFPIASIYPALTLILGLLFLNEIVSVGIVAGLVLVLVGVVLISRVTSVPVEPGQQAPAQGVSYALGAAALWAVSMLMIAPGIRGHDSVLVASVRVPALSLVLWAIVAARGTWGRLLALSRRDWVILLVGGLIGWGLGSMLFVLTVSLVGPTQAAILTSTSPMFALPLSALLLRERLHARVLVGTALTICGVILVS
jgi:drug/metabolite transporter (DMT)-like permease